jgi:diguanylate cyclase (GGDEF)-like protein/PAS domain S-box-containing protein
MLRAGLAQMFALALLPGLVTGGAMLAALYLFGQEQLQANAMRAATSLGAALDQRLEELAYRTRALAVAARPVQESAARTPGRAGGPLFEAATVALVDGATAAVLGDSPPAGMAALASAALPAVRAAVSEGTVVRMPLYGQGAVVSVAPLGMKAGAAEAVLLSLPSRHILQSATAGLPRQWIAAILGPDARVIARSVAAERFIGQPANRDLLAVVAVTPQGVFSSPTLEGIPSFVAYARSPQTGFTAVVAMPRTALLQNLHGSLQLIAAVTISAMALGAVLTWYFQRSSRRALQGLLTATADATEGGLLARVSEQGPREIAALGAQFNALQTARAMAEVRLRLAARIIDSTAEGILVTDAQHRIVQVNQALLDMTGYRREELIGQTPRRLQSGRHGPEEYAAMNRALAAHGQWQGQFWDRRRDGSIFAAHLTINVLNDGAGRPEHYVALFTDITSQRQYQDQCEEWAFKDVLTGLPNRRLLEDRLKQALARAGRGGGAVWLCSVDLDGFKQVNDTLGHEAGDAVLAATASRLGAAVRSNDTVARLGGDEFVVLLSDIAAQGEVQETVERVLQSLREPVMLANGEQARVTASVGIACYPRDAGDAASLMRQADRALYRAKGAGRDRMAGMLDPDH